MYLPPRFAEHDLAALDQLLARDSFVTLVSTDADGQPFASHLPVLYRREGERVRILGHWSRANPQVAHDGPVLLIVHGPHAYVSPTWYTDPDRQVPTWNYAIAHIRGRLRRIVDRTELRDLVARLAEQHEQAVGSEWRFPASAPGEERDLAGIVGFALDAEQIQLKFKLNQNHPAANVRGAAEALIARGGGDAELGGLMLDRLQRRPPLD